MPEQAPLPHGDWLAAFDLPRRWAGQSHFTLLDAGHCNWLNFLTLWQAWQADPQRPRLLHCVTLIEQPAPVALARHLPELQVLADQLQAALWGLLPGFQRLAFDNGQVLLTVCVGAAATMLRQQVFAADAVWLHVDAPLAQLAGVHSFKAIAACCRRGTRVAAGQVISPQALQDLMQCGFTTEQNSPAWCGEFNPRWHLSRHSPPTLTPAGTCTVIGAGLAGAAVAASLARRGWRVTVLDAAAAPASGASGLPAGILAPHISPDDSLLSRLSRAGARITLQQAAELLHQDLDWSPTGVLERCLDHPRHLPAAWQAGGALAPAAQDWVYPASDAQRAACGLAKRGVDSDGDGDGDVDVDDKDAALWHVRAGWVKPAQLVNAWLRTPGVQWRGNSRVSAIRSADQTDRLFGARAPWQVIDDSGSLIATSDLVVLAAGYASAALAAPLCPAPLALQAIRGQVTWAPHATGTASACPTFPVNGHGHLLANLPLDINGAAAACWLIGSSFERDNTSMAAQAHDDAHNLQRLQTLLPRCASTLAQTPPALHAWAGVRCATPTRLPSVGPLPGAENGVWVCSGMGSRGLTFAALCAELLAAQLHGEPWPVDKRLGQTLQPAFKKPDFSRSAT